MNITDVIIRKTFTGGSVMAIVSIVIDNDFAVHDLKVVKGNERVFVAMPSRISERRNLQNIVHPINSEARRYLEKCVLDAYYEKINTENIDDTAYQHQ